MTIINGYPVYFRETNEKFSLLGMASQVSAGDFLTEMENFEKRINDFSKNYCLTVVFKFDVICRRFFIDFSSYDDRFMFWFMFGGKD